MQVHIFNSVGGEKQPSFPRNPKKGGGMVFARDDG